MTVTVYTKDECVQCVRTTKLLEARGVSFEPKNIADPAYLAEAKNLGYLQAPVVVTDEESWSGFRPDKIEELVKRLDAEEGK